MEHHEGVIRVSYDKLAQLLHLPANAEIVAVSGEAHFRSNELLVKVRHAQMPLTREASSLVEVIPYWEFKEWHFGSLDTFKPS